jgi:hypothetical protein
MGREKDRQIQAEDNWKRKAQKEDLHCKECGSLIEYSDRDIYFQTGRCGSCENILTKDD